MIQEPNIGSVIGAEEIEALTTLLAGRQESLSWGHEIEAFEQDFEMLVENSLKGSTRVNPAPVSTDDMRVFLRNVFSGTGLA